VCAAIRGSSLGVAVQTLESSADTSADTYRLGESTPRLPSQSDLDRFSI
jgi:hypothetical protein